jgi:photosystem II stability/assembly factor-like uncharacterized protein
MDIRFRLIFLVVLLFSAQSFIWAQDYSVEKCKWKQLGPIYLPQYGVDSGRWSANGMGWIESVAVWEKKPKVMYAGSNTGGLYRTRNGGKRWRFAFDVERVCGVTDIVIDEDEHKKIWVATGTTVFDNDWGLGVLYSPNGGKSWEQTALSFTPQEVVPLWCLERSKINSSIFYACSETDIFRTTDSWSTWSKVYDEDKKARVHFRHLVMHNESVGKVIASGDKILVTNDEGKTWIDASPLMSYHKYKNQRDSLPDRYVVSLNPTNNDQVLVLYEYSGYNYIERSNDFGKTWFPIVRNRSFNRVDRNHAELAWHPLDSNIIIVGGVRIYVSKNGGKRFETMSQPVVGAENEMHDDIRDLLVLPNGKIYTGNDGGVGMSSDTGHTWQNVSGKGLTVTQFFDIAVNNGLVVGGCQDLSSMLYYDGEWKNTSSIYGDGGNNLIREDGVYVMQSGRIRKGSFSNKDWETISVPFSPNRFSYPFMNSPFDSGAIWATDHHLWEYNLENKHWKSLSEKVPPIATKIFALDAHPDGVAFFSKDQPTWDPSKDGLKERLYKGVRVNESFDWEDITSTLGILAWREITSIEINPLNSKEVYIGLYGFDNADRRFKVYKTIDGGANWENISEGLPDVNTFKILCWKNHLFLATDGGVFHKRSSEKIWRLLDGKMPKGHVTDIEIDESTGSLYASTYGNGLWWTKLPNKWRKSLKENKN